MTSLDDPAPSPYTPLGCVGSARAGAVNGRAAVPHRSDAECSFPSPTEPKRVRTPHAPPPSGAAARRWATQRCIGGRVGRGFRVVLCPTDLSGDGDRAIDLAMSLAAEGARVHVLHVQGIAPQVAYAGMAPVGLVLAADPTREASARAAEVHVRALVGEHKRGPAVQVQVHVLRDPDPASAILTAARGLGADVIVMARSARSTFRRLVAGSVSSRTLRRAEVPVVLLCPAPGRKS